MIYPGIDGLSGRPSIFEYLSKEGEVPSVEQSLELISHKVLENGVIWLQYKFHAIE